jgi:hypothetical protein
MTVLEEVVLCAGIMPRGYSDQQYHSEGLGLRYIRLLEVQVSYACNTMRHVIGRCCIKVTIGFKFIKVRNFTDAQVAPIADCQCNATTCTMNIKYEKVEPMESFPLDNFSVSACALIQSIG